MDLGKTSPDFFRVYTSSGSAGPDAQAMGSMSLAGGGTMALVIAGLIIAIYVMHLDPEYNLIPGGVLLLIGTAMTTSAWNTHGKSAAPPPAWPDGRTM